MDATLCCFMACSSVAIPCRRSLASARPFLPSAGPVPTWAAAMHIQEVIELDDKDQRKLWEEVSRVCRALKSTFAPGLKLNIAAIGNVVGNCLDHLRLRGLV